MLQGVGHRREEQVARVLRGPVGHAAPRGARQFRHLARLQQQKAVEAAHTATIRQAGTRRVSFPVASPPCP